MKKITIAIADDHPVVVIGLKSILSLESEIDIVGNVLDINLLLEFIKNHKPDILLLDISFKEKNSLDYIKEIKNESPKTKILILTMHEELSFLQEALIKGAAGFLPKCSINEDLLYAIKSLISGGIYIHPVMAEKLAQVVYNEDNIANDTGKNRNPEEILWSSLSRREHEVLIGVAKGFSNKEIGLQCNLSEKTVATYRLRGFAKLRIINKTKLLELCLKLGLIT